MIAFPPISPEVFTLSFGEWQFALRWYALAYIAGIFGAISLINAVLRRPKLWDQGRAPVTHEQFDKLIPILVIGGIIAGGRLGYVLFYNFEYYLQNPSLILKIWEGGMSFHGGFLGVVLSVIYFAWRYKVPIWSLADLMALAAPMGLFFGRVANFINAELWGRPTDVPWGVIFPGEAAQYCPGVVGPCARHPSQLYEAGLEGLLLGLLLLYLVFGRKWLCMPGAVSAVFFIGYGFARFSVEMVRQPDALFMTMENPVGYAIFWGSGGLTMGQILTLPMILVGIGVLIYAFGKGKGVA